MNEEIIVNLSDILRDDIVKLIEKWFIEWQSHYDTFNFAIAVKQLRETILFKEDNASIIHASIIGYCQRGIAETKYYICRTDGEIETGFNPIKGHQLAYDRIIVTNDKGALIGRKGDYITKTFDIPLYSFWRKEYFELNFREIIKWPSPIVKNNPICDDCEGIWGAHLSWCKKKDMS